MAEPICVEDGPPELATPTRNRYFYAKLLDVAHLSLEQDYLNGKRWLLNRLALGRGVLCGLTVTPTSNGEAVVVTAGVAVDELGREVVVPAPSPAVEIRKLTDACGRPTGELAQPGTVVTLGLGYHECLTEFVPTPTNGCDGLPGSEASSVEERYRLVVTTVEPPNPAVACPADGLWQAGQLNHAALAALVSQPPAESVTAYVPLAKIKVPAEGQPLTVDAIDPSVRPIVYGNELLAGLMQCLGGQVAGGQSSPGPGPAPPPPPPPPSPPQPQWTVVNGASWLPRRGLVGRMSVAEFRRGLAVEFSGPVRSPEEPGQGWFLVTLETLLTRRDAADLTVERVREERIAIQRDATAVFVPHPNASQLVERLGLPLLCRVVLKCGVLLDGRGNPVDGNFHGSLPTGDGVAGGDFESWFILDI